MSPAYSATAVIPPSGEKDAQPARNAKRENAAAIRAGLGTDGEKRGRTDATAVIGTDRSYCSNLG
jgi:hypothetical protein